MTRHLDTQRSWLFQCQLGFLCPQCAPRWSTDETPDMKTKLYSMLYEYSPRPISFLFCACLLPLWRKMSVGSEFLFGLLLGSSLWDNFSLYLFKLQNVQIDKFRNVKFCCRLWELHSSNLTNIKMKNISCPLWLFVCSPCVPLDYKTYLLKLLIVFVQLSRWKIWAWAVSFCLVSLLAVSLCGDWQDYFPFPGPCQK